MPQKVLSNELHSYVSVTIKVLLDLVYYQYLLLAHIADRIVKLGVYIAESLLAIAWVLE